MAYASWAIPAKQSGSGNDTVNWTGQPHTGRVQRTTTATFNASGVNPVQLTINQTGKTEFVSMDDSASVSKTGGTVTVSGVSNSSKLTFSISQDGIGLTPITSYIAAGASATNGQAIADDPGAAAQYEFSVTFTGIGENETISPKTAQITVMDNAGHSDTCLITQASGDAYLSIVPTEITLSADGTPAVSVAVTSNTSWTIS